MADHFIELCRCGAIIRQCRCAAQEKTATVSRWEKCLACAAKAKGGTDGKAQQNSNLPESDHRPIRAADHEPTAGAEVSDARNPEAEPESLNAMHPNP